MSSTGAAIVDVRHTIRVLPAVWALVLIPGSLMAQTLERSSIPLTIDAGRSLEIVIDQRVTIKTVGQSVAGTLVEPLYAYDRIVVPAGTKVLGHVAALEGPSKVARTRAILSGDLTPLRHVVLQFDALVYDDGRTVDMTTAMKAEIPNLKRTSAPPAEKETEAGAPGTIRRAEREAKNYVKQSVSEAKQKSRDILAEITQPGRTERAKQAVIDRLPYHPQAISAGTGYHVELVAPLDFGRATPTEPASADARPAPSSILNARLVTTLDSSKTPRGTLIRAVVSEPVFSADHQLIFPEGTTLEGEVTFSTPAKGFHRNGQLRFLFERVQLPSGEPSALLASLESAHTSGDDHMVLDDEGGAKLENPKTRFIAPALALLALRGNLDRHDHLDPDGDGHVIHSDNPAAVSAGGFFGLGLLGIPLSHMAPPVGLALSIVGAAKTVYSNILSKGREVQFPADTPIRLQLAPGPLGAQ
jgi:hypothetical protein